MTIKLPLWTLLPPTLAGVLLLCGPSAGTAAQSSPLVIHVAPDGNDANEGNSANLAAGHTGPVRSIQRAIDLARASRSHGGTSQKITIALASGDYPQSRTLVLTPADSGTSDAPLSFLPEPGATPRVTGGTPITGWRAGSGGEWSAPWSGICPQQLYVDGERRSRPRLPASGWFFTGTPTTSGAGNPPVTDALTAKAGDIPADFRPDPNTEILIIDAWTDSRLRVADYDPATHSMRLNGHFVGHGVHRDLGAGLPYAIDNAPTAILAPGTWQCDPTKAVIRYQSLPGESTNTIVAIAPQLAQLLTVAGNATGPVHDIVWRGVSFAFGGWALPPEGWAAMQAEVGLPGAITVTHARNIRFDKTNVAHTGATAITIGPDAADVSVTNSMLADIGGGGVAIGSAQRRPVPGSDWSGGSTGRNETYNITIANNKMTALGRIHLGATGIWSGQAHHVRLTGNSISDLYYSGISIGWVWLPGATLSHDNLVADNTIANFGQGVMSDFGGIYTLGDQPGTLVARNFISQGHARNYGGHGLYADQASGHIRFDGNRITDTSDAPIQTSRDNLQLTFTHNSMSGFGQSALYCNRPAASDVSFVANSAVTDKDVPATSGACGDASYAISDLNFISRGSKRVVNKPSGSTDKGPDFMPVTPSPHPAG